MKMMEEPICSPLVSLAACRTEEQRAAMHAAATSGRCPFCHLDDEEGYIMEGSHWTLRYAKPAYHNNEYHILLIAKRHVCNPDELDMYEKLEWFDLYEWVVREYNLKGGALVMRFGSLKHSGGSVAHLHSHIIVPQQNEGFSLVVFRANEKLLDFLRKNTTASPR